MSEPTLSVILPAINQATLRVQRSEKKLIGSRIVAPIIRNIANI